MHVCWCRCIYYVAHSITHDVNTFSKYFEATDFVKIYVRNMFLKSIIGAADSLITKEGTSSRSNKAANASKSLYSIIKQSENSAVSIESKVIRRALSLLLYIFLPAERGHWQLRIKFCKTLPRALNNRKQSNNIYYAGWNGSSKKPNKRPVEREHIFHCFE